MRFNQLYPQAEVGFRTDDGFRKGRRALRCIVCQCPTAWFNEQVCLYFCSPDCWEFYLREEQRAPGEVSSRANAEAPHSE